MEVNYSLYCTVHVLASSPHHHHHGQEAGNSSNGGAYIFYRVVLYKRSQGFIFWRKKNRMLTPRARKAGY